MSLKVTLPTAYGVASYPPGATFGPRRLMDYEFVWIMNGSAEYECLDVGVVYLAEGSVALCRRGVMDMFRFDHKVRTRHAYFHFDIRQLPHYWPPVEFWPWVYDAQSAGVLVPLFGHVLTCMEQGNEQQAELAINLMLEAYVGGETGILWSSSPNLPEPVDLARRYIARRLDEDPSAEISLEDIAASAGVSPEYLCRLFRSHTGLSPLGTVRICRLDRAAMLLLRSNYTITQISRIYGFSSPFHFSQRFKELYGRSPSQLRREAQLGQVQFAPILPEML